MSTPTPAPISEKLTAYDETPYPSSSFPQSHPNRLAAMARLFDVNAKSPSTARVLELGAADGANLLPMAEQAPQASFLGIDASRVQVGAGLKAIEAAGLKNVELRFQNILDFAASEGKFDYIIAHGIYSWVPEPVREKMLAICQEHLAENGIAYISYNALPGWNMRRSLRDMMLFHTRGFQDPKIKVQQARALLKFLAQSVSPEKNAYGMLLKSELDLFSKAADNYFRHDILEEENTAFYFHEFCARAEKHGLQYLSEPALSQMLASNFTEDVRKTLAQVGNNIIAQEQYMDFLRNRMFRQTLLCRKDVAIKRNVSGDSLRKVAVQSLLKPRTQAVDLALGVSVGFETQNGQTVTTTDPFLKAVLMTLTESGARALAYNELLGIARGRAHPFLGQRLAGHEQTEDATLLSNLLKLYMSGYIEISAEPVAIALTVPEKPLLSPLMRYQALNSNYITNRMHQALTGDVLGRNVMALCDGTRTKEQLIEALVQLALEQKIQVAEANEPVRDAARIRALLAPRVETVLPLLAKSGFFVP